MSAKIGKNFLIRFLNKLLLKFGLLVQTNKLNELFIKKFKENKGIKFNFIFKSVSNNDFDSIIFCVLNNLYDKKFKNIELAKLKKFDYKIIAIDKASNILAGRYYYFNTLFVNNEIYKKIHEEK